MATLIDSYSETNQDGTVEIYNGFITAYAQGFTGASYNLDSCKFYLKKNGSPTGNAVAKLYTHTGTFGSTGTPTGAALATSDNFNVATLTTSYQLITFTFSGVNRYSLVAATKYCIALEFSGGDGSNVVHSGVDNSSPSHGGNDAYYFGGSWTPQAGQDLCFYVYGEVPATTKKPISTLLLMGVG